MLDGVDGIAFKLSMFYAKLQERFKHNKEPITKKELDEIMDSVQ